QTRPGADRGRGSGASSPGPIAHGAAVASIAGPRRRCLAAVRGFPAHPPRLPARPPTRPGRGTTGGRGGDRARARGRRRCGGARGRGLGRRCGARRRGRGVRRPSVLLRRRGRRLCARAPRPRRRLRPRLPRAGSRGRAPRTLPPRRRARAGADAARRARRRRARRGRRLGGAPPPIRPAAARPRARACRGARPRRVRRRREPAPRARDRARPRPPRRRPGAARALPRPRRQPTRPGLSHRAGRPRAHARGGAAVYAGSVARAIAAAVAARGGVLTTADLARYRPRWRRPLYGTFRGRRVLTFPPPGSGGIVLEVLGLLARDDLGALGAGSPTLLHLLAGALAQGFADRARWYGDPAFTAVPVPRLLAPARLRALRARLSAVRVTEPETALVPD